MRSQTYYTIIIFLSLIALFATGYLVYQHYKPSPDGTSLCDFGSFSCTTVNQSYFSSLFSALYLDMVPRTIGFDIPFSVLGVLTYLALILLGLIGLRKKELNSIGIGGKRIPKIILYLTTIGVLFSAYLTVVEAFILDAWCLFCVVQAILITLMFFLTIYQRKNLSVEAS